jgi:uncharacterized protein RhaS with RHS repeats
MPNLGRWLNRDPLQEQGGINLYAYVNGDPLGYVDPDGRHPVLGVIIVASGIYIAKQLYDGWKPLLDESSREQNIREIEKGYWDEGDYEKACASMNQNKRDFRNKLLPTVEGAATSVPGTMQNGPFPTTGIDVVVGAGSAVITEVVSK